MTIFQILTLPLLVALLVWEVIGWVRMPVSRRLRLARAPVWAMAAWAIAEPGLVQQIAVFLGIGRGTDVVLYLFALSFLVTAFAFYARLVRQQQQLTAIVRHLAIVEARKGNGESIRDSAAPLGRGSKS
jgi:hypothetical protein